MCEIYDARYSFDGFLSNSYLSAYVFGKLDLHTKRSLNTTLRIPKERHTRTPEIREGFPPAHPRDAIVKIYQQINNPTTLHPQALRRTFNLVARPLVGQDAAEQLMGHSLSSDVNSRHYTIAIFERLAKDADAVGDEILKLAGDPKWKRPTNHSYAMGVNSYPPEQIAEIPAGYIQTAEATQGR